MLNESDLAQLFKMDVLPIKDGDYWNGKPFQFSNLNWQLNFTQKFGMNPAIYAQFGMKGHNGIDIGYLKGCPVVAPCKLWISWEQEDPNGYGNHIFAETETKTVNGDNYKLELVFGHAEKLIAKAAHWCNKGDLLMLGDSTGFSTGDHLHFAVRPWIQVNQSTWKQMFQNNGYAGYINPEPFLPHIVYNMDECELNKKEKANNIQNMDNKLIFNNDNGTIGWFYNGKLRIPKDTDRYIKMIASYLVRKDGVNMAGVDFDKLEKEDF